MVTFEFIDGNIGVIRNRASPSKTSQKRGATSPSPPMSPSWGVAADIDTLQGSPSKKYHGRRRGRRITISAGKLFLYMIVVSLLVAMCTGIMRHRSQYIVPTANNNTNTTESQQVETTKGDIQQEEAKAATTSRKLDAIQTLKLDWSHCKTKPPTQKPKPTIDKKVEPLWLPAYPTSIPTLHYSELVEALTGVENGHKTYYRTSPTLKRCHILNRGVKVGAVTCESVHPIVPANRPNPAQQSSAFGNVVLLSLRNPITAFPSHYQSKAEAYHSQVGQVSKDNWIKFREQYVGSGEGLTDGNSHLFKEFKNFVMTWRNMEPYYVAEYMPYESWADEVKGPAMIKRITQVLINEGFPVRYDPDNEDDFRDISCLWHKLIYLPMVEDDKKRSDWYESEYSKEQLSMMISGLEKFSIEIADKKRPGDEQLIEILHEYIETIRMKM